eukprot:TRINITY_DN33505_c0_g1_i1.p1 TRINITY_DN33505_c0_g1~~TRINITY_DN33505_c0_g1_i1.p1  ORF type:complete len:148 (-),score=54.08 TRINITY_DN33505_c0_g1_i1:50-493(-)
MSSLLFRLVFFFFKQKTAYEMQRGLVGSEMCIRDSINAEYMGSINSATSPKKDELPYDHFALSLSNIRLDCYRSLLAFEEYENTRSSKKEDLLCVIKEFSINPVSYTHLTLPTILLVQISVVAVSLKKKKPTDTKKHNHATQKQAVR